MNRATPILPTTATVHAATVNPSASPYHPRHFEHALETVATGVRLH